MQFFPLLSIVLFGVAVSARTTFQESCGAGTVISNHTLTFQNRAITVTTTSCPGFAALRSDATPPSRPSRRLASTIGNPCTTIECDTAIAQPKIADCDDLTGTLIAAGTITFAATPQSLTQFVFNSCFYGFANFDVVTYHVPYENVGLSGETAATACYTEISPLATFTAGFCLSPEVSGNDWGIEIIHT